MMNTLAFHTVSPHQTPNMILEQLRLQLGCEYLSDLLFLTGEKREQLELLLTQFPHEETTEREWDEVCAYLQKL